jgi:hypothetical protein
MSKQSLVTLLIVGFVGVGVGLILNNRPSSPSDVINTNYGRGPGYGGRVETQSDFIPTRGNCLSDDCLLVDDMDYPAGELARDVVDALDAALDDEYKALSTYLAVIEEYGSVRPFSMIKGAEETHIAALKAVYDKYGLEAPENPYLGTITPPTTLGDSCTLGVEAEIANAALYQDELLPVVADYPDITAVFTNLMTASEAKHLPAFERCAN